jgi:nitrite reductase/ring-hydroxylating ferredoxin subunit
LTDWQDIDPPARRVGLVHGLINLTAAGLMGTSLFARRREMRASGRALGLLGFLAATAAARLGGNLVYENRVGVDRSAEKDFPQEFRRAAAEADLQEGKPLRVKIDDTPIVLVKSGSEVFALAETCSHLGGPLAEGTVEGQTIQCPWHGSRFSLKDGSVVNGPAVHRQSCLEVRTRDGQIEVRRRTE